MAETLLNNSINWVPLSEPKLSSEALDCLVCCIEGNWISER